MLPYLRGAKEAGCLACTFSRRGNVGSTLGFQTRRELLLQMVPRYREASGAITPPCVPLRFDHSIVTHAFACEQTENYEMGLVGLLLSESFRMLSYLHAMQPNVMKRRLFLAFLEPIISTWRRESESPVSKLYRKRR